MTVRIKHVQGVNQIARHVRTLVDMELLADQREQRLKVDARSVVRPWGVAHSHVVDNAPMLMGRGGIIAPLP